MYIIYHKFAGYLKNIKKDDYTNDITEAHKFNTRKEAELEISGYLERVEKIETQN